MITVSLCLIVKNEEATLWNCLASAQEIADEIIIVDTGSTDRSKEIASEYTNKIYDFEWIDNFAQLSRNQLRIRTYLSRYLFDCHESLINRCYFIKSILY